MVVAGQALIPLRGATASRRVLGVIFGFSVLGKMLDFMFHSICAGWPLLAGAAVRIYPRV